MRWARGLALAGGLALAACSEEVGTARIAGTVHLVGEPPQPAEGVARLYESVARLDRGDHCREVALQGGVPDWTFEFEGLPAGDYYLRVCLFGCQVYADAEGNPLPLEVADGETAVAMLEF